MKQVIEDVAGVLAEARAFLEKGYTGDAIDKICSAIVMLNELYTLLARRETPKTIPANCLSCKNWRTGKCKDCLEIKLISEGSFVTSPERIVFTQYRRIFLTPDQYLERTGEPWPDNWAVYSLYETAKSEERFWAVEEYGYAQEKCAGNPKAIICATEAGPPPDDWEPEEKKA
jgi:hypothetical protein